MGQINLGNQKSKSELYLKFLIPCRVQNLGQAQLEPMKPNSKNFIFGQQIGPCTLAIPPSQVAPLCNNDN